MKTGIFISAGLGDAVLMVPLIKKLKTLGSVTGFFDSPFQCQELFKRGDLFDDTIVLDSYLAYLKAWMKYSRQFDLMFLNYFSTKKKNLFLSLMVSKEVRTNNPNINCFGFGKQKIKSIKPIPEAHESLQNLRLYDPNISMDQIHEIDFNINITNSYPLINLILNCSQPCSSNSSSLIFPAYQIVLYFRSFLFSKNNFF